MATEIDRAMEAVVQSTKPHVTGTIIKEDKESIVIKSGDAIIEVPVRHVANKAAREGMAELTLAPDAQILVGTVVSVKDGFIGDNVFGNLVPHCVAHNCNCNCNCGGAARFSDVQLSELRRPFTGGARRTLPEDGD